MTDTLTDLRVVTHHDDRAPRAERWRVLRELDEIANRWQTIRSFPTQREADAFARGFVLGYRFER